MLNDIKKVSLSMFRKNFFGVYHGSISARTDINSFVINKKEAIFDEIDEESLIELNSKIKDYRWNISSLDTHIHDQIYMEVPEAKYISYTMPPYTTAYAMKHTKLTPHDYFGAIHIGQIPVYDPGNFHDWYDRAPHEISDFFQKDKSHMMLIKGYGLITHDRDIREMAKRIALLENSARLLILNNSA